MEEAISIPSFPSPVSAGATVVKVTQPTPAHVPESDLLKSIRQALSATTPIPNESPRRSLYSSSEGEEELVWHDRSVVWSVAGIQRRKWIFETETKDQVLWACWASFDESKFTQRPSNHASGYWSSATRLPKPSKEEEDEGELTFGRHSHIRPASSSSSHSGVKASAASSALQALRKSKGDREEAQTTCICIFLTSFAMIYTKGGGLEYATNLPFHVKRVWNSRAGGVMIERVVTDDEPEDEFLPSVFSLAGPYEEVKVVGFAYAIDGGFPNAQLNLHEPSVIYKDGPRPTGGLPSKGKRKEPDSSPPSFSKHEEIIFMSEEKIPSSNRIIVSHDPQSRRTRVWRYVREVQDSLPKTKRWTAKKKTAPPQSPDPASPKKSGKPKIPPPPTPSSSSSTTTSSPTKTAAAQSLQPFLPRSRSSIPSTPTQDTVYKSMAMAQQATLRMTLSSGASLAAMTEANNRMISSAGIHSVAELAGGPPPQTGSRSARSASLSQPGSRTVSQAHARNGSQTRNELSITMDRMVLGSGEELRDYTLGGRLIDDQRMKPEFWVECLYELEGANVLSSHRQDITAAIYDTRLSKSTLAILIPSSNTVHLFSLYVDASRVVCRPISNLPAIAIAPVLALRPTITDLLVIRPNHTMTVLTFGLKQLDVHLPLPSHQMDLSPGDPTPLSPFPKPSKDLDTFLNSSSFVFGHSANHKQPTNLKDPAMQSVTVVFDDGSETRTVLELCPREWLIMACFAALACVLPVEPHFAIVKKYLQKATALGRSGSEEEQFACFSEALSEVVLPPGEGDKETPFPSFGHPHLNRTTSLAFVPDAWSQLSSSLAHSRLSGDTALRHLQLPEDGGDTFPSLPTAHKPIRRSQWVEPAMYVLHLLGELFKVAKQTKLLLLAPLLVKLARHVQLDYADHWSRICPESPDAWRPIAEYDFDAPEQIPRRPPDVFEWLQKRIQGSRGQNGTFVDSVFPSPSLSLSKLFNLQSCGAYGNLEPWSSCKLIVSVLHTLSNVTKTPSSLERSHWAVMSLISHGFLRREIDRLPFAVGMLVREALRLCQEQPKMTWSLSVYALIGRVDLAKMSIGVGGSMGFGDAYRYKKEFEARNDRDTIERVARPPQLTKDGFEVAEDDSDLFAREFTDVRFGVDRRLREVDRMLRSSSVTTVKVADRPDLNEHDLAKEQNQFALYVAERTLSLPIGRALYTFGTLESVDADCLDIPRINLTVKLVPHGTTVQVDHGKPSAEAKVWAEFHNGAAAALRICRSAAGVDSTWIAFNRPSELNARHAGFIFGLGLNGHLKGLYTWHTFSYLTPKHDMTSMAMLLGLSASHVGTKNMMVTKMLTVHTPALLPPGAAELNVGLAPQMAALMGLGVLHLGTRDRRMAEATLNEMAGRDFGKVDISTEQREAYSVTAGLSFGLIMCGQGLRATSPAELEMVANLRILFSGQPHSTEAKTMQPIFDQRITSPSAAIALGLMFLKTERVDVAALFEIDHSPQALFRVQPNVTLVCSLAYHLIMWKNITPTVVWVNSQVPKKASENEELQSYDTAVRDSYDLAYHNMIAGACFAVALKYAGSADQAAETTLIYYYDMFSRAVSQAAMSFDSQIKRSAVRDSLNLLSLCIGIVMAGTGELNALRRLRFAHGQIAPFVKFGSHMTTHMALGMLFLGGGRYTLGTSNAAIASLVTAFYPRWPNISSEWKGLLPAFRHFWVLAVEPRCLIARDADSGETVYLPVKIQIQDGEQTKTYQYTSPSLIPDFSKLKSIIVDSPRYWPYYIDLSGGTTPGFAASLMKHQTIWVKRRSGYLGYGEDPRGNRSIFARVGFRLGDTSAMDFPTGTEDERAMVTADLRHFITSLSVDSRTIGFADWMCRAEPESRHEAMALTYCQQSLLECLIHDKPSSLHSLLSLYMARYCRHPDDLQGGLGLLGLTNLKFVADFYSLHFSRSFGSKGSARPGLIRSSLLQAAVYTMDGYVQHLREDDPEFMESLFAYLRGEGLHSLHPSPPLEDMAHSRGLRRKLAFYLTNERVVSPEWLRAVREEAKEIIDTKEANEERMNATTQELKNAVLVVAKSLLLRASGLALAEMTYKSFEDVIAARCLEF